MNNIFNLFPAFAFLLLLLYVSYYIQKTSSSDRSKNFVKDYFIGGRTLGGFVLAMTTFTPW